MITVNFSFQLCEEWVSLETATANNKHIGELQLYCSANWSVSAGNSFYSSNIILWKALKPLVHSFITTVFTEYLLKYLK